MTPPKRMTPEIPRRGVFQILRRLWAARWAGLGAVALLGFCLWLANVRAALPPEQDVRNTVRTILARREFVPPPPNLLDRLSDAMLRAAGRLVEWLLRPVNWLVNKLTQIAGERSPVALWMVVGLLGALLLLVTFHIYYMSASAFRSGRPRRPGQPTGIFPLQACDLLDQARAAAAAGQFREAVGLTYQAALRLLDQAGVIRYDPSLTNWDYAHQLAPREPLGSIFAHLTSIADRAMYSNAPVSQEHYRQSDEFLARTQELLR